MSAGILIRAQEGCDPDPNLLPDSVWSPSEGIADFRIAGAGEPLNRGGLAATRALETAVILALFTDARLPDGHPLAELADGDPRGWWGDRVDVRDDLGESELGSLLWLLRRAPLTFRGMDIADWARQCVADALMPLQRQGAVVRIDVETAVDFLANRLDVLVQLYGRDGARIYDRRFDDVWKQLGA